MTTPFEHFQDELNRLVATFGRGFDDFAASEYSEARLRQDFLDPFFRALGWDMENKRGLVQSQREVEIESRTDVAGRAKRADYLFRVENRERFVCEAKKPREVLGDRYAFQTKRYAWNKGLPLAVLSDFEEIKIYVVGGKPHIDRADEGLWKTWGFREYPLVAQEIWNLLARERVAAGSIDAFLDALPKAKAVKGKARQQWLIKPERTKALDQEFLEYLDGQRHALASDLFSNNPHDEILADRHLNEAAQRILDRLLFLRICEDRDIDTGCRLAKIVETWRRAYGHEDQRKLKQGRLIGEEQPEYGSAAPRESLWWAVVSHLRAIDRRPPGNMPYFNGNLFKLHFSEDLRVGDQWLCDFIEEISADESPYLFSVIPVEILGSVYERFLGKVVRPHGRGVTVEEKPEVRKAGGVYYTPRYIVNYIVEQTVGKQLDAIAAEDKAFAAFDKKTRALKILDPACGSGSFLIRAFERVCEHYQRRFTAKNEDRKPERCWTDPNTGDVHLTVDLKRRILRDNIYGVDLDAQAVEVTQLSLYLKMLEGEDRTSIKRQRELFRDDTALLPPLEENIKHGNSLIASDFSIVPEDLLRVHAFDWDVQFKDIMRAGGFDAVIGNPPWGADLDSETLQYLSGKFSRVVQRMVDSYIYFTDQALRLKGPTGSVGFVIPSTVLNQVDAKPLRTLLIDVGLSAVVNLGKDVFTRSVLNTTTLIATSSGGQGVSITVGDLRDVPLEQRGDCLGSLKPVSAAEWLAEVRSDPDYTFFARIDSGTALLARLRADFEPLSKYTLAGVARGVSPDVAEPHVLLDGSQDLRGIERFCLRRSISGKNIKRYLPAIPDQWIIYTHKGMNIRDFPRAISRLQEFRHLNTCKEVKEGKHPWWALHRARDPQIFRSPKLIGLTTTKNIEVVLDETEDLVVTDAMYVLQMRDDIQFKAAMGVLHSKLFLFLYRVANQGESRVIPQIKAAKIEPLPFPNLTDKKTRPRYNKLVELVDKMLALMPKLRAETDDSKRKTLQNAADATDRQIDRLVYELYGLTEKEIAVVEGGGQGNG